MRPLGEIIRASLDGRKWVLEPTISRGGPLHGKISGQRRRKENNSCVDIYEYCMNTDGGVGTAVVFSQVGNPVPIAISKVRRISRCS